VCDAKKLCHVTVNKCPTPKKNNACCRISYTYVNKKCNRRILIRVGKLIPDSLLPGLFFFRALLTNKEGTRVFIRPDPSKEQPYLNDRKSTICTFLSESNTALSFFVRIESV
jgi:hypothetical protein